MSGRSFGPPVVMGSEDTMRPKAHGSSMTPVQQSLRWGCDPLLADDICNFNRTGAEVRGYWLSTSFGQEARRTRGGKLQFYDSTSGQLLFTVPQQRSMDEFLSESKRHGWPSFRDAEVNWTNVRVLPGGETVSRGGTHLGHNLPDGKGNRYCINLVSVAGYADDSHWKVCFPCLSKRRVQRHVLPPVDPDYHYVRREHRMKPPFPPGLEVCAFGAGCFWGVEKGFWRLPGVYSTAVGFCGGHDFAIDPSYLYVCTGESGHCEAVQVVWDAAQISIADLLRHFWQCHDPTQDCAQGCDKGSQYRSAVFCSHEWQATVAHASLRAFDALLSANGYPPITTEVRVGCPFYYADYSHQQYLAKPGSRQYCSAEPTGVIVPSFDDWHWRPADTELRSTSVPKLPEDFWDTFDDSIAATNDPVALNGNASVTALERQQRASREAAELERRHSVVLQYCGSGGYERRALELAAHLQRTCGIQIGLAQDPRVTGNFCIKVRGSNGCSDFFIVHDKKAGDGFVDTAGKLKKVVLAIADSVPESDAAKDPEKVLAATVNFAGLRQEATAGKALARADTLPALPKGARPRQPPASASPTLLREALKGG